MVNSTQAFATYDRKLLKIRTYGTKDNSICYCTQNLLKICVIREQKLA